MNMRLRISIRWMKLAFPGVGMPNGGITSEGHPGQKRDKDNYHRCIKYDRFGSTIASPD
jgi:hypothetical protein